MIPADPTAGTANQGDRFNLICPRDRSILLRSLDCYCCPLSTRRFEVQEGVVRFVSDTDPFYEGAYTNQIFYRPRGRGFLRELLAEDGVKRIDTGSAIGDLLVLARSQVLLASGSSFSAWASFLGQMPTLSHPGQSLTRLIGLQNACGCFVGEFDPKEVHDLRANLPSPGTLRPAT